MFYEETVPTRIYTHHGKIYVPHYVFKGVWVGPCGNTYKEGFLKTYCIPGTMMLWKRASL